jgi:hypothetical protein
MVSKAIRWVVPLFFLRRVTWYRLRYPLITRTTPLNAVCAAYSCAAPNRCR